MGQCLDRQNERNIPPPGRLAPSVAGGQNKSGKKMTTPAATNKITQGTTPNKGAGAAARKPSGNKGRGDRGSNHANAARDPASRHSSHRNSSARRESSKSGGVAGGSAKPNRSPSGKRAANGADGREQTSSKPKTNPANPKPKTSKDDEQLGRKSPAAMDEKMAADRIKASSVDTAFARLDADKKDAASMNKFIEKLEKTVSAGGGAEKTEDSHSSSTPPQTADNDGHDHLDEALADLPDNASNSLSVKRRKETIASEKSGDLAFESAHSAVAADDANKV